MTDEELITSYLKGDEEALSTLIERYLNSIYRFVFYYVHDESVSSDLTQDTFVKVWKNLKKFDTDKNFKTWLYKICKNTVYDYLKKKKLVLFSDLSDDGKSFEENIPDTDFDIEREYMINENRNIISGAISSLSIKDQEVLRLHYFESFTFEEISNITDESVNTIKSRSNRAINKLREKLEYSKINM